MSWGGYRFFCGCLDGVARSRKQRNGLSSNPREQYLFPFCLHGSEKLPRNDA